MSHWTFDTQIELTPIGRTVANLHKRSRQLKALEFPGMNSDDRRLKKIAQGAANDAGRLLGTIEETLWTAGAAITERDEETTERAPASCTVCKLCNIHGAPSCSDDQCPNRLPVLLSCGCYADACYCGQYPEDIEVETAVLEMLPEPSAAEFAAHMNALTEQSNFFGDPRY